MLPGTAPTTSLEPARPAARGGLREGLPAFHRPGGRRPPLLLPLLVVAGAGGTLLGRSGHARARAPDGEERRRPADSHRSSRAPLRAASPAAPVPAAAAAAPARGVLRRPRPRLHGGGDCAAPALRALPRPPELRALGRARLAADGERPGRPARAPRRRRPGRDPLRRLRGLRPDPGRDAPGVPAAAPAA